MGSIVTAINTIMTARTTIALYAFYFRSVKIFFLNYA